jgi:hypothetical protein
MITASQARSYGLPGLLREVQKSVYAIVRYCVSQSDIDLGGEFVDIERCTVNELRGYAEAQDAQPQQHFNNAFRLIHHRENPDYGVTESDGWADLEAHIGWRHAHRATLSAVLNVVADVRELGQMPAVELTTSERECLRLAKRWAKKEVSTREMLLAYKKQPGDAEIWGSIAARTFPIYPHMFPPGQTYNESRRKYIDGYYGGMAKVASRVDSLVSAVDVTGKQDLFDFMEDLDGACQHFRAEAVNLWVEGDTATAERNHAQQARERSNAASRLAGMVSAAWDAALKSEVGDEILRRPMPWQREELAKLLAEDFERVLHECVEFDDPDIHLRQASAEEELAEIRSLQPRTLEGPDLALSAAL